MGTLRCFDVDTTSIRRRDGISTLYRRRSNVVCPAISSELFYISVKEIRITRKCDFDSSVQSSQLLFKNSIYIMNINEDTSEFCSPGRALVRFGERYVTWFGPITSTYCALRYNDSIRCDDHWGTARGGDAHHSCPAMTVLLEISDVICSNSTAFDLVCPQQIEGGGVRAIMKFETKKHNREDICS